MSEYEYDRENYPHHHHHRREESPYREEYVVQQAVYPQPPAPYVAPQPYTADPYRQEYAVQESEAVYAQPPAPYGQPQPYAGSYGAPVPNGTSSYGEGYPASAGPYGTYGNYPPAAVTSTATEYYQEQRTEENAYERAKLEERKHKREEEFAEVGALASGGFAMYERHEVKTDPENARRHRLEEEVAAGLGLGAGGYALYERHERKESKEETEAWEKLEGHKKHHGFFG
ncbi:hypothetical protein R1sor_000097 [Riccia sorocarpa]|uniref:Uncharacterized protein n=1 Tax=Riccia sorocarpa TaxID=122646 RepID=A0ABD3GVD5_9MARC